MSVFYLYIFDEQMGPGVMLGRDASRRRRIQAWREVNELPGRGLMRGGLWWSGASAGAVWPGLKGSTA